MNLIKLLISYSLNLIKWWQISDANYLDVNHNFDKQRSATLGAGMRRGYQNNPTYDLGAIISRSYKASSTYDSFSDDFLDKPVS